MPWIVNSKSTPTGIPAFFNSGFYERSTFFYSDEETRRMVRKSFFRILLGLTAVACLTGGKTAWFKQDSAGPDNSPQRTQSRIAVAEWLPPTRGSHLRATLLEVTYPPGGHSNPHIHPCPVLGFVLTGVLLFQADGGSEQVLKAGQSFYEAPNSHHLISANASTSQPAKFLAYFVCDGEQELTKALESGRR